MPSDTTRNTLIRQWELLKLLPKRGTGKTAKDLAATLNDAGFKVSKRQIERDLSTLSGPFPLDCKDQSIPYGWKWMDGRSVELPGLTVAEALSMKLVEETLQSLLPKSVIASMAGTFKQAHEKLASLDAENPNALWREKVRTVHPSLPFLAPHINSDVLEVVQEALLLDKQLEIEYQSISAEHPSVLILHPLGLVNRGPVSYIVATAFEYTDVRLYALHRVSRATKLAADTIRPVDFRLDDYIDEGALQFGNGKSISLKANVTKQLSLYLTETPLSTDQQLHVDAEKIKLTCTAIDSLQLRWWILSQGAEIEILAPAALRTNIANIFRQSAEIYEPEK
jgi:predicted DNA-binding transcriptional regulator YafY